MLDCLPADWRSGLFLGRVETAEGPTPLLVEDGIAYDMSRAAPTVSQLIDILPTEGLSGFVLEMDVERGAAVGDADIEDGGAILQHRRPRAGALEGEMRGVGDRRGAAVVSKRGLVGGRVPMRLLAAVVATSRVRSERTASTCSTVSSPLAGSKSTQRTVAPAASATCTHGRMLESWSRRVTTTSSPGPHCLASARARS